MSTFAVKPVRITIEPHDNADSLELARVGDYRCVVKKGQYRTGSLVFYVPEAAIVPSNILKAYGFWNTEKNIGMLAGSDGNRVKAIKLRGELSQGIVLPIDSGEDCNGPFFNFPTEDGVGTLLAIDDLDKDYAEELGIVKWEPPIPVHLAGEMYNAGTDFTVNYDIENIKAWPDVITEYDEVVMTEKLHGTFCQVIFIPEMFGGDNTEHFRMETERGVGYIAVSSKGMGAKGLCFKHNERNANNAYLRATTPYWKNIVDHCVRTGMNVPVIICGEVFGDGVQDLKYGMTGGKIEFRVFDIYVGKRGSGQYLSFGDMERAAQVMDLQVVPVLYKGPFKKSALEMYAQHTKSVFDEKQIREGVVIKPTIELRHDQLGRVILKSINEDYLLRKGNATEFN